MTISWYTRARECVALRKHAMRVDMHIHAGEETDFNNANDMTSAIQAIISAAIIKGLDMIGLVAHSGPNVGLRAQAIAHANHYDIWITPGQEYDCTDKFKLIIYNLKTPLPPNLDCISACTTAHQQGGLVMAINLSKRQAQQLNKVQGGADSPDCVEIYNSAIGGYLDAEVNYPKFMNSAAKSAVEVEKLNVYTVINRNDLEQLGFIPKGYGEEYTPGYLNHENNAAPQSTPAPPQKGI